jgi:D-arabinose 1-dehydrogenase-like Zn-dependent alcohol dehydrogenase
MLFMASYSSAPLLFNNRRLNTTMSTAMMRAVRFHSFGSPEVLVVDSIPRPPSPAEGQVLVRVRAAGVNPFDAGLRAGFLQNRIPITLPAIPGVELSGTIEDVGPDVTAFAKGQYWERRIGRIYTSDSEYCFPHAPQSGF